MTLRMLRGLQGDGNSMYDSRVIIMYSTMRAGIQVVRWHHHDYLHEDSRSRVPLKVNGTLIAITQGDQPRLMSTNSTTESKRTKWKGKYYGQ